MKSTALQNNFCGRQLRTRNSPSWLISWVCAADKRPIAGLISVQANAWLDLQVLAQAVANDETFAEYIHCRLRPAGSTAVACEAAVVRQENLSTLSSPVAQERRLGQRGVQARGIEPSSREPWLAYALALLSMLALVLSGMLDDERSRVIAGWIGLGAVIAAITWTVRGSLLGSAVR